MLHKSVSASMITEDHMKKLLSITSAKKWKPSNNKMLPKSQHSCFGDFPPEYMNSISKKTLQPVPKTENHEVSIAISKSKSQLLIHSCSAPTQG